MPDTGTQRAEALGITKYGSITHISPSVRYRHLQRYLPCSTVNTDGGEVVGFNAHDLPDLALSARVVPQARMSVMRCCG
jgi:hypothetical protein